ncbi:MAG: hypothetical protein AAF468_15965 [Pseudomonadota bacterium]
MLNYGHTVTARTARTLLDLAKIMLPIMILVRIGESFGLSAIIGSVLEPVMQFVGLPGETGLIWAIGILTGMYGALAALLSMTSALDISVAQLSILASMILFAHGLPIEQAIVKKVGGSFWATTVLRVACAIAYGLLVHLMCDTVGVLQQPVDLSLFALPQVEQGWLAWAYSTARTFLMLFAILLFLLVAIDGLKRIGAFEAIVNLVAPLGRLLNIDRRLMPLTVTGMLLGLSYGSGLLMDEMRDKPADSQSLFPPLALLSISHGLIEDTIVMMALGADFWIVFAGKLVFSCAVIWFLNLIINSTKKTRPAV